MSDSTSPFLEITVDDSVAEVHFHFEKGNNIPVRAYMDKDSMADIIDGLYLRESDFEKGANPLFFHVVNGKVEKAWKRMKAFAFLTEEEKVWIKG